MAKRLAENQLTPEELARQLDDENAAGTTGKHGADQADQTTLEQRKIVRVKRHRPDDRLETEEVKGSVFKLIGSLNDSEIKPSAAIEKPAFLFKPFN